MTQVSLRSWQHRFVRQIACHPHDDFLLVACPAAGKTIAAAAGAAAVMTARECDQLIVVCPSVIVRDQWARELGRVGYRMLTAFPHTRWPAHVHGVCATYAQLAHRVEQYVEAVEHRSTVVVFDEIHHASHELSWGTALRDAFAGARMRLMLSGTPFRSDETAIPFVRYAADGRCVPDFAYEYAQAVRDGVCRPVRFHAHDGVLTWREPGRERTARFTETVDESARRRRLRAALDPSKPYLASVLAAAHRDLLEQRRAVPDAAGLIVCDSQPHALAVDQLVTRITGSMPVLAMSDLPRAHQAIAAFAVDPDEWLVSVRMVSEGVDIPRLGVIVWATAASTELMIRQVAGRALRGRREYLRLPAIVHLPADPQLVRYAGRIEVLAGISSSPSDPGTRSRSDGESEPEGVGRTRDFHAVDAQPVDLPALVLEPQLPASPVHPVEEPAELSAPELPPAPEDLAAAAAQLEAGRAQVFKQLATYAQLRRLITPAYQLASAHRELASAVGQVLGPDASSEDVAVALEWLQQQLQTLASAHPAEVMQLARTRRRLELAA